MAGLITSQRPTSYKDVVGQDEAVSILKGLEAKPPSALLIQGPTGLGKTTLARIFARRITGYKDLKACLDYTEINVGADNGIDKMRDLITKSDYAPFGKYKVIVLDEVHKITPSGLSALLKTLEEPPPRVIWLLATNEPGKLPRVNSDRLTIITLDYLEVNELIDVITRVCHNEKIELDKTIIKHIAESSLGTPRLALSILEKVAAKIRGKSQGKDAKNIKIITDEIIAGFPNMEDLALNLLGAYYSKQQVPFIKFCLSLDVNTTNNVVRIMSNINEFMLLKHFAIKKKFFCSNWSLLSKVEKAFKSQKNFEARSANLQVKLASLLVTYPLQPLQLYSLWTK